MTPLIFFFENIKLRAILLKTRKGDTGWGMNQMMTIILILLVLAMGLMVFSKVSGQTTAWGCDFSNSLISKVAALEVFGMDSETTRVC
ncbi:MAG: hypothetical protein K0B02_04940 [DPANN group archaeon]|nr:hypothetical protein [DPANN group archaeon]